MADADLGTARGRIDIDATGLRQLEATLMSAGRGLLLFGGATGAAFIGIVGTAATFEQSMSKISAISDATGEDLDQLRKLAIKMGQDTAFGAIEAANSFETLAKAGFSVQEIIDGVGAATLNLAAAGDINLDLSADLMASAIRTFGLAAEEAPRVADVIAAAANESQIDVADFANTLKYAGGAAAAQGVPIEDLSAIIATMGEKGIKASQAGTALRTMFTSMAAPTKKAAELMKELGITTDGGAKSLYDMNGTAKPLGEQLKIIDDATKGLGDQQRTAAFKTIFGQRALSAMLLVLQDGTTDYERFREAMLTGDAETVAAEKLDNLAGAWKKFKASIETLFITSGSPLQKSLQEIVEFATKIVNGLGSLPPSLQAAIPIILAVITVVSLLSGAWLLTIGTIIRAVRTIGELRAGLSVARGAIAGFFRTISSAGASGWANPYVLIAVAILAIIAALVYLYFHNEKFRKFIDDLWQGVQKLFGRIVDFFSNFKENMGMMFDWISEKMGEIVDTLKTGWEKITGIFDEDPAFIKNAGDNYDYTVDKINKAKLDPARQKFADLTDDVINYSDEVEKAASKKIDLKFEVTEDPGIFDRFFDFLGVSSEVDGIKTSLDKAKESYTGFMDDVADRIDDFSNTLLGFYFTLKNFPSNVANYFKNLGSGIGTSLGIAKEKVTTFFTEVGLEIAVFPGKVQNAINNLPQILGEAIGTAMGTVLRWLHELPGEALNAGTEFKNNLVIGFNLAKDYISETLGTMKESVQTWATDTATSAWNTGYNFFYGIYNWISQLPGRFVEWLTGVYNTVVYYGGLAINSAKIWAQGIYNGVVEWVSKIPNKVGGELDKIPMKLASAALTVYNKAVNMGKGVYNGIADGIGDIAGWIQRTFNSIISTIERAAIRVGTAAARFGRGIWDGFRGAIFGSPHTKVEYALWDMEANAQKSVEGLRVSLNKVSEISKGMGTFETQVVPIRPNQLTPAQLAAQTTTPKPTAQGLTVEGPLVAVEEMIVRNDQDILHVSRSLADLVEREQLAQGKKAVAANA